MKFVMRDWRMKCLLLSFGLAIISQVSASILGIYISTPSEDIVTVWNMIATGVSWMVLGSLCVCALDIIRTDVYSIVDETYDAFIKGSILIFEGGCILAMEIIPMLVCFSLLGDLTVPDILKGLIVFPFAAYLTYSVGEPTAFGSFYIMVGVRK